MVKLVNQGVINFHDQGSNPQAAFILQGATPQFPRRILSGR